MIQLPSKFYKELDILQNHIILKLNQYDWDTLERCRKTIQDTLDSNKKYIFLYKHETISNLEYLDELYKIIEYFKIYAIISTSTTSSFPKSTHPLTNLLMWRDITTRKNISWNSREDTPIFDGNYFYGKLINEDRNSKGILSIRKENHIRDYVFSKNPKIDNGTIRYASWPHNPDNLIEDEMLIDNFPNLNDLIMEYENSYFSFIIESEHGNSDMSPTTNLTEKTLISILTGTIPIILGGKNIVSELGDMGIKVWNNEFGFGNGDYYSTYSEYKAEAFLECIKNVNKLTLSQAKNYWQANKKIIQNNYDLVSYILFDEKFDVNISWRRFASISAATQGKEITDEELKAAEKIGKKNEKKLKEEYKNKNNG